MVAVGPAVWRVPGAQLLTALQTRLDVAVAGFDSYSVELQTVSGKQEPPDSYLPAPHVEHTRSEVAVGVTLCVSPVLHCPQGAQAAALSSELNVLAGHAVHVRSEVAVGATLTNVPAAHTLSEAHSRWVLAVGADFSYSVAAHCVSSAHTRS